jgi:hypothetical protein
LLVWSYTFLLHIALALAQSLGQTVLAMRECLRRFFLNEAARRYQIELDMLQCGVTQGLLERAAQAQGVLDQLWQQMPPANE